MGDLSENFSRAEFACGCGCGFDTVDAETLRFLEKIRSHFDRAITINSGCRCASWNVAVGGSHASLHVLGRAADIRVDGVDPALVYELAHQLGVAGLGKYDTFTHIDTRSTGMARWEG